MDKKYLEEQMSAYLDGELSPDEMSQYEQEIKSYPDLFAELQTLQRLNKLAGTSKLALPDDRYFENLAGRIDSQINPKSTGQRSRIVDFIVERRKAITVISSVAAVFLVAVISMNLFGPSAKRYPNEIPTQKSAPAKIIDQSPKPDSVATIQEQPLTKEKTATLRDESAHQNAVIDEGTKDPEAAEFEIAVPDIQTELSETNAVPAKVKTESAESKDSKSESRILPPSTPIKKGTLNRQSLSADSPRDLTAGALQADSPEELRQSIPTTSADTVIIYTATITPSTNDSYNAAPAMPKSGAATPNIASLQGSSGLSWNVYLHVFQELDEGMYRGWKLSGSTGSRDSLQAWKDSISVLGPARWYAEQAFRSLQAKETTWEEYQQMRAYIDHYMAETQIPDSAVWNRRLPLVDEIYERQLGKQYRDKK